MRTPEWKPELVTVPSICNTMRTPNRILIGLDFSNTDYRLIEFLNALSEPLAPEKLYFLHVSPSMDIPDYLADTYKIELEQQPLDEKFKAEMIDMADRKLKPGTFTTEFDVIEGPVTKKLIQWAKMKHIDLAIMGKKAPRFGSGISVKRFLRQTNCSVLFVPDQDFEEIKTIVVPVDFSENASMALTQAIEMATQLDPQPVIKVLNVFDVPTELQYRISRTYGQFTEIVRKNTEDFFPQYLSRFDSKGITIEPVLIQNTHFNTARHIMEYAREASANMLVVGAQGHSALESFLLGSVTEKLMGNNDEIPTWIVRPSKHEPTENNTASASSLQAF